MSRKPDIYSYEDSRMLNSDDLWPEEPAPIADLWPEEPALDPRWLRWHQAIDDGAWDGNRESGQPCKVCRAVSFWKDASGAFRHPPCGEPGPASFLPCTWGENPIRSGHGGSCSLCRELRVGVNTTIMVPLGRYSWAIACLRCAVAPTPPLFTHEPQGARAHPRKPKEGQAEVAEPVYCAPAPGTLADHEAAIKGWMRHAGMWPYEILEAAGSEFHPEIGPAFAGVAAKKNLKTDADGKVKLTEGLVTFLLMGMGALACANVRGKFYYFPKPKEVVEDLWPEDTK